MELHEKLQVLRHQQGWTQEELAQRLYVSRTAVSKWESGRGIPGIDSLKAISQVFDISIDSLLSGEELLTLAEADRRQSTARLRRLLYGILDCLTALLLFLPCFGQPVTDGSVQAVSLLALESANHIREVCLVAIGFAELGTSPLAEGRSSLLFAADHTGNSHVHPHSSALSRYPASESPGHEGHFCGKKALMRSVSSM